MARTHDMDRKHMQETFRRAHDHHGAAFVEIYQNCNVFNDGAFEKITSKDARPDQLIPLVHGQPIRFGTDLQHGVVLDPNGHVRVAEVADVGEDALLVHDEHRDDPGLAFQLSRLARGPYEPTPIGVFRDVDRTEYGDAMTRQLLDANGARAPVTSPPSSPRAAPGPSSPEPDHPLSHSFPAPTPTPNRASIRGPGRADRAVGAGSESPRRTDRDREPAAHGGAQERGPCGAMSQPARCGWGSPPAPVPQVPSQPSTGRYTIPVRSFG